MSKKGMHKIIKRGTPMYIKMSNELTRAAQRLTLMEKRLAFFGIAQLDKDLSTSPSIEDMTTRIPASEFSERFGIHQTSSYESLKVAARSLESKSIKFNYKIDGSKRRFDSYAWVTRATYAPDEGFVELVFNLELNAMFFELEKFFTAYSLDRASTFRSVYTWRLFELIMQFKQTGWLERDLTQIHEELEVPKSIRSNFSLFRTKVLEKALGEIAEKDGLKIKWEAKRKGRKVVSLRFSFPVEKTKTEEQTKTKTEKTTTFSSKEIEKRTKINELLHELRADEKTLAVNENSATRTAYEKHCDQWLELTGKRWGCISNVAA